MTDNRLMIGANTKENIPEYLFTETGELNISDANKILSVTAEAVINSVDALNNELRVNVTTTFKVIYDGEDGVNSYAVKVDSNRAIMIEGVTTQTRAIVYAAVLDCEYAGANSIKAKCTVQLNGWYARENTLNFLNTELDDIFCKTSLLKVENVEILPESKLSITYTNEARLPISKMLDCAANVYVNNVFANSGSFQVEGEIALRMIFLSDNGEFMNQTFTNPFSAEIADEVVQPESSIDVYAQVNSIEVTLSAQDNRGFISDINITLHSSVSNSQELEGIVDAYSTTNTLSVVEKKHNLDSLFCLRTVRDKVSTNAKIANGINDVECVTGAMVNASSNITNGVLQVEGVITSTVIYQNEEGHLDSINVELPFQTMVAKDIDCDTELATNVIVTSMFARIRTTSEIEVSAEIMISVKGKRSASVNLVSDIEIGPEKEVDDVAISLYIVKPNQSIWEVAKDLNTSEAVIITQNPELKLPVKAGDKVVLYKEINFEI
ncbi:MAG: DUF3794 domain-containing protein [Clostridiales bacterium]|nr:DUF3794 domain-containing protein [Clostridiales bacterium]